MNKTFRLIAISALVLTAMAFSVVGAMALVPPEAGSTPAVSSTPDVKHEVVGVVTAIDSTGITIDGTSYSLGSFTEIKGTIQVGDTVKLELVTNPDGTLSISEVSKAESDGSSIDKSVSETETPEVKSSDDQGEDLGNSNSNQNSQGENSDSSTGKESQSSSGESSGHDSPSDSGGSGGSSGSGD